MIEKVKRICIYLTQEDKKFYNGLKYQHKLSISTIANIIAEHIAYTSEPKYYEETHLYENEPKRLNQTSIKPQFIGLKTKLTKPAIFYTNILKLYARNEFVKKGFYKENQYKKIYKKIWEQFKTTKDPNWDGNEWNRRLPKYLKQNKEYYKKILGDL